MRIIGGQHRGRRLSSPEGLSTRPTSDRARQAVFNILNHAAWLDCMILDNSYVLDAFAGTGALGLEALSQGASHAVFIENNKLAAKICQNNITDLQEEPRAVLITGDATCPPRRPARLAPRTLIFLDPPYGKGLGALALTKLAEADWLADKVVAVMEMEKKQPEETPAGFTLCDERAYGVALVRFLRAG